MPGTPGLLRNHNRAPMVLTTTATTVIMPITRGRPDRVELAVISRADDCGLMPMLLLGYRAMRLGQRAAEVLKLDGGVADVEAVAQHVVDPPQDGMAGRGRHVLDQHVAAQSARFRTEAPDMEVVNVDHARHAAERVGHFGEV